MSHETHALKYDKQSAASESYLAHPCCKLAGLDVNGRSTTLQDLPHALKPFDITQSRID
jgi:hypothetical protein